MAIGGRTRRQWLRDSALGMGLPRPNILWLITEDICPDLGCYGDSWARTPNLDRLASEGVRFTNAFSVYGVCAPSRPAMMTGYYPATIGAHHHWSDIVPPPYVKLFTEHLRTAGYHCAEVINHETTHEQNIWPVYYSIYAYDEYDGRLKPEERHDPAQAKLPPYYADTPAIRAEWARYYDLITVMDRQVGERLRQLEEDGLADNTAVFFLSDHGRGLPRAKRWTYDASLRVPLIVRWPGRIAPGSVDTSLVSLIDLPAAVLYVAGISRPFGCGENRTFLDSQAPPRRYIYAGRDRMDEARDMLRAVPGLHGEERNDEGTAAAEPRRETDRHPATVLRAREADRRAVRRWRTRTRFTTWPARRSTGVHSSGCGRS